MTAGAPFTTTPSGTHVNIAQPWYDARVSVVPIMPGSKKKPAMDWKALQTKPLTQQQVERLWGPGQKVGVAAICGKISGNLEMTELEAEACSSADLDRVRAACRERGVEDVWDALLTEGYAEWSPAGGIHLMYRVPEHDIPGNTKLAMRLATDGELNEEEREIRANNPNQKIWRTRAETRGEGGYVVVAPTPGFCHATGDPWTVFAGEIGVLPELTWEQRMALHLAINDALDQTPPPEPAPAPRNLPAVRVDGELRPGDDWENQVSWEDDWFTSLGWRVNHRAGPETFWRRPGKRMGDGHSASTGYAGDKDRLYVWSTSAGLPTHTPLSKFYVYAHYYFNGDMTRAAQSLRRQGFGSPPSVSPVREMTAWEPDEDRAVMLPPQTGLDLTDTGNGRRIRDAYGDKFRYNTREKAWYEWTGRVWRRDEGMAVQRAAIACAEAVIRNAKEHLDEVELLGNNEEIKAAKKKLHDAQQLKNKSRLDAAVSLFMCEPGIAITSDMFNADLDLLNLPNGTLDLTSGELLPHDPTNMITLTMGAELDKDAEAPLFRQFLIDALPDPEVRDYVQRAMGYTMLGRPTARTLFFLHGPSGTGKSVFTELMTNMFGGYGCTAPASTFRLKKNSDTLDLHALRGARFVATSEMPEGQLLDEDLVKRISGGDMMSSRGHYEAFTRWKASCVIWIATNFLPRVNSDDNAIWRRAKTVYMGTEFHAREEGEKEGYAALLYQEERNGILNWLLEGLEQYKLQGLNEPAAITRDVEAYRVDVSITASFLRDKIEDGVIIVEDGAEAKSQELRAIFEMYCRDNHQMPLGVRRFQNQLRALGYEPIKVGGHSFWRGLRVDQTYGILGSMR